MPNKGKPTGKYAETKVRPGRKGNYQRTGWADAPMEPRSKRRTRVPVPAKKTRSG